MKKIVGPLLTCAAIFALLGGCANPVNNYTAAKYMEAARAAERAGDLSLARQYYSRATLNAQIGNLGPASEAAAMYEWSRVTGYLGSYVEAEKGFRDVLDLIEKAKGQPNNLQVPTLCELARLLHDTGAHQTAIPIFERAVPELERVGVLENDPVGFAAFLDDYATSLRAAELLERVKEISARANSLRSAHPGESPAFSQRRYTKP